MSAHDTVIQLAYLVSASLFIAGLHALNSPESARRGNGLAALGMLTAVIATLLDRNITGYGTIIAGMAAGSLTGAVAALNVRMTAMPQMVAVLNGLGGGASTVVVVAEHLRTVEGPVLPAPETLITVLPGLFIGAVTFTGSFVAFAKLQGLVTGKPILFPLQRTANSALLLLFLAGSAYLMVNTADVPVFFGLLALSLALGLLLVIPVGGADMPVVISLLNSFSGLAAAVAGFVLRNNVLIVSGALVGAAGAILTRLMSRSMNRSLMNVLYGAFGKTAGPAAAAGKQAVRSVDAEQAAAMLAYAATVVIVPGYGMAVARAQQAVRDLADQLEKRGVDVKYAIHPVAGRMPGHMNVLLAEAGVPYEKLFDMEDINPAFERTDVALVIGASDVVNPAARRQGTALSGMPILDVDRARSVIVVKRSMSPGFSGIDNELFFGERTVMLFGDARDAVNGLVAEVKKL
jgi:NAD(P) transhydrogenase subunit beta